METGAGEYFLSLLDDAIRGVNGDSLGEDNPFLEYTLSEAEKKAVPERKLSVRDCYMNCHACDGWMKRDDRFSAGRGPLHPLVVFVAGRTLPGGAMLTPSEAVMINTWSNAIKLEKSKECYLTTIIKCPTEDAVVHEECVSLLREQIRTLSPKVVLFLGPLGLPLLGYSSMEEARKGVGSFEGATAVMTYAPAEVEREPRLKAAVWEDLKKVAWYAGIKDRRC